MQMVLRTYWTNLTTDDLLRINGNRAKFGQVLQRRYGYQPEQAENAICAFEGAPVVVLSLASLPLLAEETSDRSSTRPLRAGGWAAFFAMPPDRCRFDRPEELAWFLAASTPPGKLVLPRHVNLACHRSSFSWRL